MSHEHQITDPSQIHDFTRAGRATFTLVAKKTGRRVTYKVNRPKGTKWDENHGLEIKVLSGPDNGTDYLPLAKVSKDGDLTINRHARVPEYKVRAFVWFWRQSGNLNAEKLDQCEVWHSGRCGRCGRKLTVPESISSGIGPICGHKVHGVNHPGVPTHT